MATKPIEAEQIDRAYCSTTRFGILNHLGSIWTPETFDSVEQAQAYLDNQRAHWPDRGDGLLRHKVVPVRVVVFPLEQGRREK